METGEYIKTMAEFITGDVELLTFKEFIEGRLFELRQNIEETDEKKFLSSIELYLHEMEEGLRDKEEVYANVQFILDEILLTKLISKPSYFSPTPPNLPYLLSKTSYIDKRRTKTKELSYT